MRCLVAAAWRRRAAAAAARRLAYLQKTRLLIFEFSLCLSRACLGKMIIFSIKWHKKTRFLADVARRLRPVGWRPDVVERKAVPAGPFSVRVKTAEAFSAGSAQKPPKNTIRDAPWFRFAAVFARIEPFLFRSIEKRGDQSRFKKP